MPDGMIIDLGEGLEAALRRINSLRRAATPDALALATAEVLFEGIFATSRHLAVYGSLKPGEENDGVVADVVGEWRDGFVRGELRPTGWGSDMGYPAMRWDERGDPIPIKLLVSEQLPRHWPRLDDFEGRDYRRILVPVHTDAGLLAVANIYETSAI